MYLYWLTIKVIIMYNKFIKLNLKIVEEEKSIIIDASSE